jgi:flagellar basal-body rod protein FlgF
MDNATNIALSNQLALARQMDVVANNLANANSTGFKSERLLFTQYLANLGPRQDQKLVFPEDIGVVRNFDEGPLVTTGNPLDLAIHGSGFFMVNTPNGQRYTRAGNFTLNTQGQIVDSNGDQLLDERGNPINIPSTQSKITISSDGTVSTESGQVARLAIMRFDKPETLREEHGGLFAADNARPSPASGARVVQGSLENSNVQSIVEITRLMEITRAYQNSQRMIDSEDQRQRQAIEGLTKDA